MNENNLKLLPAIHAVQHKKNPPLVQQFLCNKQCTASPMMSFSTNVFIPSVLLHLMSSVLTHAAGCPLWKQSLPVTAMFANCCLCFIGGLMVV